jgi:hypothetical protein
MTRILAVLVAALTLTVAGLSAQILMDDGGSAEAQPTIECNVVSEDDVQTITCTGTITIPGPIGGELTFTLVVTTTDNPPSGPSFNDEIISCTLDIGAGPEPIDIGPCQ